MRTTSPLQRYRADLKRPDFSHDPAQERAVRELERIHREIDQTPPPRPGLLRRLRRSTDEWPRVRGAYLWGGVGRGKTYLMDCFYETLDIDARQRVHFHRFMQDVHQRARELNDVEDPLRRIAIDIAERTRVLCFDEFFVSDVADAMILARLLNQLFAHGITLVTTSNIAPDGLYRNGLQRARFLPAIEQLQQHCAVVQVDGDTDYRLRLLEQAEIYHSPLDAEADLNLDQYFRSIAPDAAHADHAISINGRAIPVRKLADGIAWFDFSALCEGPRAAADYIEIARLFGTVLLSAVPRMDWTRENEARRFLHLIDEFYDRRVNLIVSAEVPMEKMYQGEKLRFEYDRVVSRLQEMQSHDYLAAPHIP